METFLETSETSVLFNVFHTPFVSPTNCEDYTRLLLKHRYSHPHEGSMQKHTIDASSLLSSEIKSIVDELTPTINTLFYENKDHSFNIFTAHAVLYDAHNEGEKSLDVHKDDSDITINITLMTENLVGNQVRFQQTTDYGNEFCRTHFERMRQKTHTSYQVLALSPTIGDCILHRGDHPHETSVIWEGRRLALILWLKKR